MHPRFKARVVYLVPCLSLFLDVVALKDSTYHKFYGIFLDPPYPSLSSELQYNLASL